MASLASEFLGIKFPNPFILASAPPTANSGMIIDAFTAGWGGAVLKTIGLVPTPHPSPRLQVLGNHREKRGMVNIELISDASIDQWEIEIDLIKSAFPDRPLIASIMGGGNAYEWQEVVRRLEPHGIDAFEMNVSCPNFSEERGAQLGQDPESLALAIRWVREATKLPVIVKLTPNVTDIVALAKVAKDAGADAVTATNTLSGLAGIDLDSLNPLPTVDQYGIFGGYSGPGLKPVSLRCVASIAQKIDIPIIGCGGIESWRDAAEYMAVGASLVEVCTSVMWNGYGIIKQLNTGLLKYLEQRGASSITDLTGKALPHIVNFPKLNLEVKLLAEVDEEQCNGCGICVKACQSGGFSAITLDNKKARVDFFRCDGCGLCVGVCPYGIIKMVSRDLDPVRSVDRN